MAFSGVAQQESSRRMVVGGVVCIILAYMGWQLSHAFTSAAGAAEEAVHAVVDGHAAETAHADVHVLPPAFYSSIPFAVLLLCIALLPLMHKTAHWWEHNSNKLLVALSAGGISLLYYAFIHAHGVMDHHTHTLTAAGLPTAVTVLKNAILGEYIPFIVLLFSLYVVSGGVAVEGHLVGRPQLNVGLMTIGGILASLVGTTGAAMLLIRPLLRANANRKHVAHTVVFFTFVVCNTGGCLLPIGDPPLFLGYLRGVDFAWTLSLWPMWLFMNISLLAVYFVWDSISYRKEDRKLVEAVPAQPEKFAIKGVANFVWMAGVVAAVAFLDPSKPIPGTHWSAPLYFREIVMLAFAALSLFTTSATIREKNSFSYGAILEVAALFIGIFLCMQAPVQILNTYGPQLGIDSPMKFFWVSGILSSFLDNAPTYVVFFETAKTLGTAGPAMAGVAIKVLTAISLGSVFMGAMTYIGNGPNFMVKAIAETNNVKMPSFFGYMAYSCSVLLPLSLLMSWLFLS